MSVPITNYKCGRLYTAKKKHSHEIPICLRALTARKCNTNLIICFLEERKYRYGVILPNDTYMKQKARLFIKKNPTKFNNASKFYIISYLFVRSSTCFGWHIVHHQEPKTALAASGFSYVEGCWTCSWWKLLGRMCLTTSTNYTSNNLPRMKNQRLPVQF